MKVSINPSYFCNFRCDFCYLTEEQLGDQKRIDLNVLDNLLSQLPKIEHIDLYGGEIGALKKDYFYALKDVIKKHYSGKINLNTNFSMLHEGFFEDDVYLSVSYDFEAREKSDKVFSNMMQSPVDIGVLILASPRVLQMDVDFMINMLNVCTSVKSVEIKPYSSNQANAHNITNKDYEDFVIKWLESPIQKNFFFTNESRIDASYYKEYNAFSNDHIYITPNGKFAVLEFDLNDNEFFLELDSWQDYIKWTEKEKREMSPICKSCEYFGHCLTEHYRYVKDLEFSCNGHIRLLEWWDKNA